MTEKEKFKGELIPLELFTDIVDLIIKQRLTNNKTDVMNFVFHGGEVLMYGKENFYKAAEYITKKFRENNLKLKLGMQTNGILIDDDFSQIFNHFDINIGLSFDGINDSNNDRDIKEEIFENKFDILERNHVKYSFLIVCGKHNIDNIKETRKYIEDKGMTYKINWAEDMINPGLNSEIELNGTDFFNKIYIPQFEDLINDKMSNDDNFLTPLKKGIIGLLMNVDVNCKSGCGALFCGSTIGMIGVNPDGTSHYCDRYNKEYEDTFVMNVLDYDFLGLHQLRRAFDFNKILHNVVKETGCDTCLAKYLCEGGCMAFHRSKYGVNGIDKEIVCNISKNFYSYLHVNIISILKSFIRNNIKIRGWDKINGYKTNMMNLLGSNGIEVNVTLDDFGYNITFEDKK